MDSIAQHLSQNPQMMAQMMQVQSILNTCANNWCCLNKPVLESNGSTVTGANGRQSCTI